MSRFMSSSLKVSKKGKLYLSQNERQQVQFKFNIIRFIEIIVKTIDEFNSQLQSKSGNAYVLFTASYNDEGVRWCPDCRNAEPYLDKKLSDSSISEVIVIEVNRADYKVIYTRII